MKRNSAGWLLAILVVAQFFAFPVGALAKASDVVIDSVDLYSGNPYWKNGNLIGSESDWNVYYDAANKTVTMKNAVIERDDDSNYLSLIQFWTDITLILEGENSIGFTGKSDGMIRLIEANNNLTITGSGSLKLLNKPTGTDGSAYGIEVEGSLTINSGAIYTECEADYSGLAILAYGNLTVAGGSLTLRAAGKQAFGLAGAGDWLRISGGVIDSRVTPGSNEFSAALFAINPQFTGGEGTFINAGDMDHFGLVVAGDDARFTAGHHIFAGNAAGIYMGFELKKDYTPRIGEFTLADGPTVYVSAVRSGDGKTLWLSDAEGSLFASDIMVSPFRYVELISAEYLPPNTGDNAAPWLWAGVIGLCLLLGVSASMYCRKRSA